MSSRVSRSCSRHSSRRTRCASAYGPGTPASVSPSHSASAWPSRSRARYRSPVLRAFSASAASSCAAARSSAPSPSPRTAYPPDSLARTPGSSTFRSRDAYVRTAASACEGGSSPHRASISSAAVAVRPSRSNSAASRARCCGLPVATGTSPRQARTGPSTPNRSATGSGRSRDPAARVLAAHRPCSPLCIPSNYASLPSPDAGVSRARHRSHGERRAATDSSHVRPHPSRSTRTVSSSAPIARTAALLKRGGSAAGRRGRRRA